MPSTENTTSTSPTAATNSRVSAFARTVSARLKACASAASRTTSADWAGVVRLRKTSWNETP